jgi:hypothetical protein
MKTAAVDFVLEGKRPWWGGRASNPVGGAMRRREGSTPSPLRHRKVPSAPEAARCGGTSVRLGA